MVRYLVSLSQLNITDFAVAEFRDFIVVSSPQRTTPIHNIDQDLCMAGPAALAELPENSKISSFTISMLLRKEWIASTCTATIMTSCHGLPASHCGFNLN
jgi:hypothetical protein